MRIYIYGIARSKKIDEKIVNKISEEEISFYKLILYLNLIEPKNKFLERLYTLGKTRNDIMHTLFAKFEDIKQYKKESKKFSEECFKLNEEIRKLILDN